MKTDKDEIGFWIWVKAHKKQLAIAGISLVALAALVLGLKNKDAIMKLWATLKKSIREVPTDSSMAVELGEQSIEVTEVVTETVTEVVTVTRSYTPPQSPVDIPMHIRNLPEGRCHSAAKAAEAAALNIQLQPNQTLVDAHTKYAA
ncbi:MAG: hypothetical protein IKI93_11520 [Clostridia bacterium]|nr:hypothetical protein [Clostridia bacterium]